MAEFENNQFHAKEFYQLQGEVKALTALSAEQFKSLREIMVLNFESISDSTSKALVASDKRLEGMNEFRASLNDLINRFPQSVEINPKLRRIEDDIHVLQLARAELSGKADQKKVDEKFSDAQKISNRLMMFTIISMAIALIAIVLTYLK